MSHILQIIDYMVESFIHTWPYLLITIPIAVIVKMSGASRYINRAFNARPIIAIFLATFVGAFSPLCSCSVIPVVASLLIGGVPLAPVMSFWLASPSMDPEIFFLTVSTLGWELAIWRLASTLVMSLGGGFLTQILVQNNLLGTKILRDAQSTQIETFSTLLKRSWHFVRVKMNELLIPQRELVSTTGGSVAMSLTPQPLDKSSTSSLSCASENETVACQSLETPTEESHQESRYASWKRLGMETWEATTMVIRFMLLAWFLGALIRIYVPETWITSTLGSDRSWAIISAALLGIPVYTSNLTAMPLVGGLLAQGMHPAAALAFLIAGPTTTLPAMSAVWGMVSRKVFALYVGCALAGAVILAFAYSLTL